MPKARWLVRLHDELAGRLVADKLPRRVVETTRTSRITGRQMKAMSRRRQAGMLSTVLTVSATTLRSYGSNKMLIADCLAWADLAKKHEDEMMDAKRGEGR